MLNYLPDKSLLFYHNLSYDILFLLRYGLKSATKRRTRFYNGELHFYPEDHGLPKIKGLKYKTIYLADSYALIPKKLKLFKQMFGLDIHKQLYPYKYYTEQRIYSNNFIGNINEVAQVENWNEKQMRTF